MRPDLARLSEKTYDVAIVGGGIYGLFAAWDAALRGLSVALVERGDFGSGTSSNSLRVIHGGLRYLQHGDILRMRRSISERTTMMRIAPHLVHPLPFLIPTYGYGKRGKAALSLALKVHDLVGFDRNRSQDAERHLPGSRTLSRDECLSLFPGMNSRGLTGAAVYFDCQMSSSERLAMAVVRSALNAGAELANYAQVTEILSDGDRVTGVAATDVLSGDRLEVRARVVVNAAGPWAGQVLGLLDGPRALSKPWLSKAFNLLVSRELTSEYALGVYGEQLSNDRDAPSGSGVPIFFITPWETGSLIGTQHLPYDGDPDGFNVTEEEIEAFIGDINRAYPPAELRREDVRAVYGGLLPAAEPGNTPVKLLKHHYVIDHPRAGGPKGLISIIGVKFTEARHVAERAVDLAFRQLGKQAPRCTTAFTPLHGAIEQLDSFGAREATTRPKGLEPEQVHALLRRYGAAYPEVLEHLDDGNGAGGWPSDSYKLLRAEAIHGVRREMAQKLQDVVFRRTALGQADAPSDESLWSCARAMADELGWDEARAQAEVNEVRALVGGPPVAAQARSS
jgi:glycerol-3-phosphate dehydrogenase